VKYLNIASPAPGGQKMGNKESSTEQDWPSHLLGFVFSLRASVAPFFVFFSKLLFWTREDVKNSILLDLVNLGVFTHCRLD